VVAGAERSGDFSSVSRQVVAPVTGQPFPGNKLLADRIDPAVKKLLPLIPVSSAPDGFIVFDRPERRHENQFMGRVDYNLAKQRLYGRDFYAKHLLDPISGEKDLVRAAAGRTFLYQD